MTPGHHSASIVVRPAREDELNQIIEVCGASLGWRDDEPNEPFFRWKHVENPFGRSPMWLALDDGRIVAVRAMMRWDLADREEGALSMVRAVDTATLPSHQGRGLFTRLTTTAVEQLRVDGIAGVFNTPNDKSRPGYLKMGWAEVGSLPVSFRPRDPTTAVSMARSRVAAVKWGEATSFAEHPATAFADAIGLQRLLQQRHRPQGLATAMSVDYLRWRTAFEPLHCRVFPLGDSIAQGCLIFRIRRRGALRQLSVLDVIAPPPSLRHIRRTINHIMKETSSDVILAAGNELGVRHGLIPMPRTGPILTWRPIEHQGTPRAADLALSMGTIELF